jgi:peroxiredoxin family protein
LEDLQTAASQGVEILACGTCLNYFELKEKLRTGRISNMYEILSVLSQAGRTVKF